MARINKGRNDYGRQVAGVRRKLGVISVGRERATWESGPEKRWAQGYVWGQGRCLGSRHGRQVGSGLGPLEQGTLAPCLVLTFWLGTYQLHSC